MQQTGATALIAIAQRLPRGAGFVVSVHELPEPLPAPAGDEQAHQIACATAMNRAMEYAVRLMPEQYLWGYDRYKQPRSGL
jgi:KDO2-lipid IV(A) lauroyltransferase